jgi:hypothetical protein
MTSVEGNPRDSLSDSLKELQTDYIDALLLPYPEQGGDAVGLAVHDGLALPAAVRIPSQRAHLSSSSLKARGGPLRPEGLIRGRYGQAVADVWGSLERLVDEGRVRHLGVKDFSAESLRALLGNCRKHRPVICQAEHHPYRVDEELVELCKRLGIQLVASTPLGRPGEAVDRLEPSPAICPFLQAYVTVGCRAHVQRLPDHQGRRFWWSRWLLYRLTCCSDLPPRSSSAGQCSRQDTEPSWPALISIADLLYCDRMPNLSESWPRADGRLGTVRL